MGSYNEVMHRAPCPSCGTECDLAFQVHTVSAFEGDETGRFSFHRYHLGEKLRWWPKDSPKFGLWYENVSEEDALDVPGEIVKENCCGKCESCQAPLAATIVIHSLVLERILDITADVAIETNSNPQLE